MLSPPRRSSLWLRAALCCALCCAWLGATADAKAQSCHAPTVQEGDARDSLHDFRASFALLAASYDHGSGARGDYEGLFAGLRYRQPWFALSTWLPAYRLARAGDVFYGLGDLVFSASGTFLRARDDQLTMGVELPLTVPTGSAERSLGMGHVMAMPTLWLALDLEPFALRAELGYGRTLSTLSAHASEHAAGHEHAGTPRPSPIVNPMNAQELEHALTLMLGLQRHLFAHVRWFGGVPLGLDGGIVRQIVGGGVSLRFHAAEVTSELQVPVAGNPFDLKGLLQVSALF